MAITAAQYTSMWSTSDSDADYLTPDEITEMTASFTNNDYINDKPTFAMLSPVIYQIQKMQDELDYLRGLISTNKDKVGITTSQANAITANTAKTGITTAQANAITANTAKTGMTIGTGANQAMAGNTTIPPVTVTLAAGLSLTLEPNIDTKNRIYELGIGVIDSSGKTPVKYTGKVTLT